MAGLISRAAALLAVAGACMSAPVTPNELVGSKACFGCHSAVFQSFRKTSMGRSMSAANDWSSDALPAEASVAQPGSDRTFEVFHDGKGWRQKESEPNVFTTEHQLEYAVGSGENGVTFLIRRGNYLFQAPLSYYTKTKKWDLSPGYEQVALGFGRQVPNECIDCHAGRAMPLANYPGAFADPPFTELAIGCENCHGAGGGHIRLHSQPRAKFADPIVNPAKLPARLAENICMNCHQSGDARVPQPGKTLADFRPGEWLFDTVVVFKQPAPATAESDLLEHYSSMQASRCFRESMGKLSCLTCHDPHTQPSAADAPAYFRAKCFVCHNEESCTLPLAARNQRNPSDDCAGCHMPKRDVVQVSHSALTNHRILKKPGEAIQPIGRQEIEGLVVVNAPPGRTLHLTDITRLRAYSQLAAANPDYQRRYSNLLSELSEKQPQDPAVQAALGHKAFLEQKPAEAVDHFTKALSLNEPAVYLELGRALQQQGRNEDSLAYLSKAANLDPYDAVTQKTLILQYINCKNYSEARRHMERYVETFPEDTFMRGLLAKVPPDSRR